MTETTLSRDAVREVDRVATNEFGVPGIVLMENAGRNAAELLWSRRLSRPVVVCCGKGNNGGDGFVMARHLENRGADVRVLLFAQPDSLRGDAATNCDIVLKAGIPLMVCADGCERSVLDAAFQSAGWIVDALLGTGISGTVREPYATAIAAINASPAKVFAVDLPSGLDCDRGEPLGACVRADVTATFVALKSGFTRPSAREWIGETHAIDIGIPRALRDRVLNPRASERCVFLPADSASLRASRSVIRHRQHRQLDAAIRAGTFFLRQNGFGVFGDLFRRFEELVVAGVVVVFAVFRRVLAANLRAGLVDAATVVRQEMVAIGVHHQVPGSVLDEERHSPVNHVPAEVLEFFPRRRASRWEGRNIGSILPCNIRTAPRPVSDLRV